MELREELLPYNEKYLPGWVECNPTVLQRVLPKKLVCIKESLADRKRSESRYFAEANIARMWEPNVKKGWYGSYSWLHSSRWSEFNFRPSGEQWQRKHKSEFHYALKTFIKLDVLRELQIVAGALSKTIHLKVRKGPDLFFIKDDDHLEFVEAKQDDTVKDHQVATLALLKRCLNASVRIVRIYPSNHDVHAADLGNLEKGDDHTDKFNEYYLDVNNCIKKKAGMLKILV